MKPEMLECVKAHPYLFFFIGLLAYIMRTVTPHCQVAILKEVK